MLQLFRTYVASVSSRCCKSRSGVAHVAMGPACCSCLPQLLGHCAYAWKVEGDEGRGTGGLGSVKRKLLGRHVCVGRGKRREMEAGECGPACMRSWEAEGAREVEGARVSGREVRRSPVRADVREMEQQAPSSGRMHPSICPGASHAL
jgi:hypothetical protein